MSKTAPRKGTFPGTVEPKSRPPKIYLKVLSLKAKAQPRGALGIKELEGDLSEGITCLPQSFTAIHKADSDSILC